MDRVARYREILRELIRDYASRRPANGCIETEAIFDPEKDHFEVIHVGWDSDGQTRIHGAVIHIDIIQGKVWIQHDGTSPGVALDLVEAGIPREDIVLGFRPEYIRQYTGFAVT